MTLPAERFPACDAKSAGLEASDVPSIACLEPFLYQSMRWCEQCGGEQIFVDVYECEAGRVGLCLGCERRELVPFSRTVEAA